LGLLPLLLVSRLLFLQGQHACAGPGGILWKLLQLP
jgi:hypothetical protein